VIKNSAQDSKSFCIKMIAVVKQNLYDFGTARCHVGKRTNFCFFRLNDSSVTYICDVKH
jgi:hypothetical protein